ncbi:MAG: ABC transporter ATP-binding protein [Bacteroidales bacterium]
MKLFKRLFKYVFPYKFNILGILITNLFYSIFSLFTLSMIVPFLSLLFGQTEAVTTKPDLSFSVQTVIDTFYYYMGMIIEYKGRFYALIYIAITMILLSFLSNFFRYLGQFFLAPIRAGVLNNVRKDIYHKIIILPLSFYAQQKKGDIMNRIGSDVQEVEWSVISTLQTLCRDPLLIIIYLSSLFIISHKLTLISLVILPIVGYLIALTGKSIKRNSMKAQNILGKISSLFEETIGGLRIIKGYCAIDHASEKFKHENYQFYKLNKKIFRINDLGSPLIEFLCILTLMAILLIGDVFLPDEKISGGVFIMYIVVFSRMIQPAKLLVTALYNVQKGMASAERIYQIIDGDEKIVECKNPKDIKLLHEKIEYRDVSFSYHNHTIDGKYDILNHINFTLEKGKIVALVGASGSGKSTIVDLLPRFYDIQEGSILIDGLDNKLYRIDQLRELFGIVNQDVILFNDTIYNNIAFGKKNVSRKMVEEAAKIAQAHHFIMAMEEGYETMIGDRGMRLSGGQRQRLSIARAILKNPQILILDEATSALDTESEYLFQQALLELLENRTAIVIAHRLSTIRQADQILFLKNGSITERGTHEELLKLNGDYARFCAVQLKI